MRITLLTPEQARLCRDVLDGVSAWFIRMREQLVTLARHLIEAARHLVPLAERLRTSCPPRRDRPAWASPYGPAPKGIR
ncbi:hypothetical protein ABZ568_00845 [Streptomyces olindensis]|uniref:Transposase n=1 Tax=Streptomyces olindensis TaxID=358823 RepID=A0ABV2XLZ7_9ACTN